jgi:hypothetical protein
VLQREHSSSQVSQVFLAFFPLPFSIVLTVPACGGESMKKRIMPSRSVFSLFKQEEAGV